MLYDEQAILRIGESKIENAILTDKKLYLRSHDEEDVKLLYAVENYIVKYHNKYKTSELQRKVNQTLESLLNLFVKDPTIIDYSYILSNSNVRKTIYKTPEETQKFILGATNLKNNWEITYNKVMNNESVSEYDMNKLMTYFSRMIDFNKVKNNNYEYVGKKIEKYMKKVLILNEVPKTDSERLFIFNYCSKYVFSMEGYNNESRNIRLVDLKSNENFFLGGYQLNSFIAMNDHSNDKFDFYCSLDQMIQCIMHETTHAIQEIKLKNNSSDINAFEMAIQKEFGFQQYKTGSNYLFNEIEEDAQEKGYCYARLLYRSINKEIATKLFNEYNDYKKSRKFEYEYVTVNENGSSIQMSKEKYNVINIRKVVKNNPELIKKYPVLKNVFYDSGDSKNIEEMLSEEFVSHDINEMYNDFILYDLRDVGLNHINLSEKSEKDKTNILKKLNFLLQQEVDYLFKITSDYDYRAKHEKMSNFFFNARMNNVVIISNFVEKNLTWMRNYEKTNPGHYELYSSYVCSIKQLMDCIQKSEKDQKIGNLQDLAIKSNAYLNNYQNNINEDYICSLLEKHSKELLIPIQYNNCNFANLEVFIKTFVKGHMDRWIVNTFLDSFYKDSFLYAIGVK